MSVNRGFDVGPRAIDFGMNESFRIQSAAASIDSITVEIEFDKKIDNSRLVREADSRCRREYICLTLLGAIFVLGALFYAWQQYQWIQYGYRIEEAQKQIDRLAEIGRQLRVERATLANPQRIDAIARGQLGMIGPRAVVVLEHAKKVAVPPQVGRLSLVRQYRYGDTTLSLFQAEEAVS